MPRYGNELSREAPGRKRWKSNHGTACGRRTGVRTVRSVSPGTRKQEENEGAYLGIDLRLLEKAEKNTTEGAIWYSPTRRKRQAREW